MLRFVHTADTHLGFEVTKVPQGDSEGRRRRAAAVFRNYERVVQHAAEVEADLFIHSGDLFNKAYIPREDLDALVRPITELCRRGTIALILPGNHERSAFPFDLFQGVPGVFVFDRPRSLFFELQGLGVGVAGFPFIREHSRRLFHQALEATEYRDLKTDLNILVTHQAFDGATVGPGDFTFRPGRRDTVARESVPTDFGYVAAGHIHRYQVLPHPRKPGLHFVYPGSTQRMSFAEMDEEKGFVEGEVLGGRVETRFHPLPAYAMEIVEIEAAGLGAEACTRAILDQSWRFDEDRVIRFNLTGGERSGDYAAVDFARLRDALPPVLECQFALRVRNRWVIR